MFVRSLLFYTVISSFVISGCTNTSTYTELATRRPLGREFSTFQPPKEPSVTVEHTPRITEPNGVINLRQALSLALMHNPELKAFSWDIRASEARTLQAGLLPNPEIEVEVEEVGGAGARSGFDGAETTIALSQLIELGNKQSKRSKLASLATPT